MVTTWGKKYHFEKRGGGEYDFFGKIYTPVVFFNGLGDLAPLPLLGIPPL